MIASSLDCVKPEAFVQKFRSAAGTLHSLDIDETNFRKMYPKYKVA